MIFFGICLCVSLVVLVLIVFFVDSDFLELLPLFAFVPVMLTLCVSGVVSGSSASVRVIVDEQAIYSLSDTSVSEGGFLLGSGYVDEELKYRYFVKSGSGLKFNEVSADSVVIAFDDEPRLVKYENKFKNKALSNWFWCLKSSEKVLYIPENTVFSDINIDLK